ncbi:MAG TPA: LuxR C-terminal-related transcriptional regulator [Acidimicrobiales bacterium]|nr:LuxR C-terminal-related transcriptional regulator [Acidimicrobiales bacterium]
MNQDRLNRTRAALVRLADEGLDWVGFSAQATEIIRRVIPFQRSCWHTIDPGTVLLTGSVNQGITCSGSWLAKHEYVLDDVNKWSFLAQSGRLAGATSLATHGDISRSARHRSREAYGIADELRGSFVADGTYWGSAGFLRDDGEPWFTEEDVVFLSSLCHPIAVAFRRALLTTALTTDQHQEDGPGVVVFDEHGNAESISPAAERWIEEMVEIPSPATPAESKMVQVVAGRARACGAGQDPLRAGARSRVQTRSGNWLLLYGTRLAGRDGTGDRTAVIIQSAAPNEVAPLVALAYGLSPRECQVTRLCLQGLSTKQMSSKLSVSAYTVQDHLKSIFEKTGVRSRGELVGQVFLEHYAPRWEELPGSPPDWRAIGSTTATAQDVEARIPAHR